MNRIGANYSHVGHIIDFENDSKPNLIYHATGKKGFHEELELSFLQTHFYRHKFDITPFLRVHPERFLGFLEGNLGKDYSESQFVGFIPVIGKWLQKFVDDNDSELICSEITSLSCTKYTSLPISGNADFNNPKQFIDQLLDYGLKNLMEKEVTHA